MSNYGCFALLYDDLTENVEYQKRSEYIYSILKNYGIKNGTLIDLACGTGSFSKEFIKLGFYVVGVDYSGEMLTVAQNKLNDFENKYALISADISEFEFDDKVDCVICCLDSINHLTNPELVLKTFDKVKSYLKNDGVFVFDVNTIHKHRDILADNTFVFDNDDYYLVWDNESVNDTTVRILLDMFFYNGSSYDRCSEEFNEIAYTIDELQGMLYKVGFKNIEIYDDMSFEKPKTDSERIYFVCS